MKKRIISLLLTVLMVAGMFSCLTVSASAAYDKSNMIAYTMKNGDNVYSVCKKQGIDFYANYNLITAVNNIKSYSAIAPGTVIYLPKPGVTYVDDATTGTGTGTSGSTTGSASGSTTGTTTSVTIPTGDYLAYYLVPYTMNKGDTIYNVCRNFGTSFNTYSDLIKTVNNLVSYSNIAVGATLLIPSATAPANTTGAYKVMGHRITSGETAASIVKLYNMDYNSNVNALAKVNNNMNLSYIQAGKTFYIPIPASTGTGSGSGSNSGSGTGTTPAPSASPAATGYKLGSSVTNGSVAFKVDGKAATTAAAGVTVSVTATPNSGYTLETLRVTKSTNGALVTLNKDNTFVMPGCDVVVKASFKAAGTITVKVTSGKGTARATSSVSAATMTSAAKGTLVPVRTEPNIGWYTQSVTVTNNKTGAAIPLTDGYFEMPDDSVTVNVAFADAGGKSSHLSYGPGVDSFMTVVGNIWTLTAKTGDTVRLIATPVSSKTAANVYWYRWDDKRDNVDHPFDANTGFTMPAYETAVKATFADIAPNKINISVVGNGTAEAQVNGATVTGAARNSIVTIVPSPRTGYAVKTITVDGKDITDLYDFVMPAKDVNVKVEFEKAKQYNIKVVCNSTMGSCTASVNGTSVTAAVEGSLVELKVYSKNPKVIGMIKVEKTSDGSLIQRYTEGNTSFIMPKGDVTVTVSFDNSTYTVDRMPSDHGTLYVKQDNKNIEQAKAGSTVEVRLYPDNGYSVKGVYYYYTLNTVSTRVDIMDTLSGNVAEFTMPDSDVEVYAEFASAGQYQITADSEVAIKVNGTLVGTGSANVSAGDSVTLEPANPGYWATYTLSASGGITKSATDAALSFTMPAASVSAAISGTRYNKITVIPSEVKVTVDGSEISAGASVAPGKQVTVEVRNKAAYNSWTLGAKTASGSGTTSTFKFNMPSSDVEITFSGKALGKVTVPPELKVTVDGNEITDGTGVAKGKVIKVDVRDKTLYSSYDISYYPTGGTTSSGTSYTMTDADVKIVFTGNSYKVNFGSELNVSIGGNAISSGSVAKKSDTVTVVYPNKTGVANANITVKDADGNTVTVTTIDKWSVSFTMPAKSVDITSAPTINNRKVQFSTSSDTNVDVTVNGNPYTVGTNLFYNEQVTVKAKDTDGKRYTISVKGKTSGKDIVSTVSNGDLVFNMPDEDVEITYSFAWNKITLAAPPSNFDNSMVTVSGASKIVSGYLCVTPGAQVTATPKTVAGETFTVTAVDSSSNTVGGPVTDGSVTFTMPNGDVTVTAAYATKP